jgi:hypothetical protein
MAPDVLPRCVANGLLTASRGSRPTAERTPSTNRVPAPDTTGTRSSRTLVEEPGIVELAGNDRTTANEHVL